MKQYWFFLTNYFIISISHKPSDVSFEMSILVLTENYYVCNLCYDMVRMVTPYPRPSIRFSVDASPTRIETSLLHLLISQINMFLFLQGF